MTFKSTEYNDMELPLVMQFWNTFVLDFLKFSS